MEPEFRSTRCTSFEFNAYPRENQRKYGLHPNAIWSSSTYIQPGLRKGDSSGIHPMECTCQRSQSHYPCAYGLQSYSSGSIWWNRTYDGDTPQRRIDGKEWKSLCSRHQYPGRCSVSEERPSEKKHTENLVHTLLPADA